MINDVHGSLNGGILVVIVPGEAPRRAQALLAGQSDHGGVDVRRVVFAHAVHVQARAAVEVPEQMQLRPYPPLQLSSPATHPTCAFL